MVDKAAEGLLGTPFPLCVERGKIAEVARATLSRNPAYFQADRAFSPPTFLTTAFFWQDRVDGSDPWSKVEMDQRRGMHAEQEYVFHGPPPRAGDELQGQSRIASIFEKAGRRGGALTFVVMVTEFRDASGKLVAEARMTGVETVNAPTDGGEAAKPVAAATETKPLPAADSAMPSPPPPRTIGPITRTDVVRYQGASGDMNPIHHDEPFALAAGHPAPLVVGMFQAGVLAAWAVDWLGAENVRSFKVRWKEPVWPGDVLTFSGKIARVFEEASESGTERSEIHRLGKGCEAILCENLSEKRAALELLCTRQTGGVAVQGWATFVLPHDRTRA
jgi:acyl dehydratase